MTLCDHVTSIHTHAWSQLQPAAPRTACCSSHTSVSAEALANTWAEGYRFNRPQHCGNYQPPCDVWSFSECPKMRRMKIMNRTIHSGCSCLNASCRMHVTCRTQQLPLTAPNLWNPVRTLKVCAELAAKIPCRSSCLCCLQAWQTPVGSSHFGN